MLMLWMSCFMLAAVNSWDQKNCMTSTTRMLGFTGKADIEPEMGSYLIEVTCPPVMLCRSVGVRQKTAKGVRRRPIFLRSVASLHR